MKRKGFSKLRDEMKKLADRYYRGPVGTVILPAELKQTYKTFPRPKNRQRIISRLDFLSLIDRERFYQPVKILPETRKKIAGVLCNDMLADWMLKSSGDTSMEQNHTFKPGATGYMIYPRRSFRGVMVVNMRRFTVKRIIVEENPRFGMYQTVEVILNSSRKAQYCALFVFASVEEAVNRTCSSFLPEEQRKQLIREFEEYFSEIPIEEDKETAHTVVAEDLE